MSENVDNIKIAFDSSLEKQNTRNSRNIKLREKARDMESIFLSQMIKTMRKTIPDNPWGGSKNDLPSMMFSSVMGKAMAKSGGIGLAKKIFNSLKDMNDQEIQKIDTEELDQNPMSLNTFNFMKSSPIESNNE
ncbi:MAG: rod-binding protein [Candidatus Marinimicrobia bacterium]|nr:rod-binding protein [Candidatus Neomarinimicrobiota bacterium]